jgi:Na+/proline symporter
MSRICSNCGKEILNDSMGFCSACGTKLDSAQPNVNAQQFNNQQYAQPQYTQPYAQPYQNFAPINPTTSIGGWIGWMLLCSILPIIGPIIMICSAKDESAKNFAKAYFVLLAISIVLIIILSAVFASAGMSFLDSL